MLLATVVAASATLPSPGDRSAFGALSDQPPLPAPETAAERYALPITLPLDQGATGLCWVFAALSMLETNYMSRHPGSYIELSRAALQRDALADRFRRFIRGEPGSLGEGGLGVEALALVREFGLLAQSDFHDVVNSIPVFASIEERLLSEEDENAKQEALEEELEARLGALPNTTHLEGKAVTPRQLAASVLGQEQWVEYDRSIDGAERWGPSHDPDARADTRVHYVALDRMIEAIHNSLKRGEAVITGTPDHAFLVYGADYDLSGKPLDYRIKDSLAPYDYRLSAETLHASLNDVTVSSEEATPSIPTQGAKNNAPSPQKGLTP